MNQETVIGDLAQIPRGEGRTFAVGSRRVAVFHTGAGVFATQADCPHLRGPLADGLTGCIHGPAESNDEIRQVGIDGLLLGWKGGHGVVGHLLMPTRRSTTAR